MAADELHVSNAKEVHAEQKILLGTADTSFRAISWPSQPQDKPKKTEIVLEKRLAMS